MSFTDDFNSCMSLSGLPTPIEVFDSISDALEFLHQLHTAWEVAGGNEEMTLATLVATGVATGIIGEDVLAVLAGAGTITVSFYLGACFGCIVSTLPSIGMSWSGLLANTDDSWVQDQLTIAANEQGIDTSRV